MTSGRSRGGDIEEVQIENPFTFSPNSGIDFFDITLYQRYQVIVLYKDRKNNLLTMAGDEIIL